MSDILARVQKLVRQGEVSLSRHGFRELAADDILLDEVVNGIDAAIAIEEYPAYVKGPSVLVLQHDGQKRPIHVLWGIAKDSNTPAVVVTGYRPDPARWPQGFTRRSTP
jgi:hypothetical protein